MRNESFTLIENFKSVSEQERKKNITEIMESIIICISKSRNRADKKHLNYKNEYGIIILYLDNCTIFCLLPKRSNAE